MRSLKSKIICTCHFRHAGLYDGAPLDAPSFVVKTCNIGVLRSRGVRCGRSLIWYVTSGNLSNSCLTGAGTSKMLRDAVACCRRPVTGSVLVFPCDIVVQWQSARDLGVEVAKVDDATIRRRPPRLNLPFLSGIVYSTRAPASYHYIPLAWHFICTRTCIEIFFISSPYAEPFSAEARAVCQRMNHSFVEPRDERSSSANKK